MVRLFINRPCRIPNTNNTMICILVGYVDVEKDYFSIIVTGDWWCLKWKHLTLGVSYPYHSIK
jgi:hypothetical protein